MKKPELRDRVLIPLRRALMLLALLSASGCVLHQTDQMNRMDASIEQQNQAIADQTFQLQQQQQTLAQLDASQQDLAQLLSSVREQLTTLHEFAAYQAAGVPLPSEVLSDLPLPEEEVSEPEPAPTNTQLINNSPDKMVLGRIEWVWVDLLNKEFKARMDTGSGASTLSAENIQPFERNGESWVRFSLPGEDGERLYESPLVRHARIRRAGEEIVEKRPVVRLHVNLGELTDEVEFTLTNRQNMLYPVSLGRNFLRDIAVVDVARKFTRPRQNEAAE